METSAQDLRTSRQKTKDCNKRRTSGDQPAERDQRWKLLDEPRTSGSA